jgi:acetyl esterase/lipase
MRRFLFIAVLACAAAARAGSFTTFTAIEFESVDGKPLLMDLRVPESDGLHPVILYLHSGAWVTGDRTGGPAIREASRGYAVASIDYRLAPQYTWPAQIEDCKAAVRWLRANAAQYQLDPNRIGVFGTSAGGHLAAMLGTTANHPEFEAMELGNPQFSTAVSAVIDFYGPTDLLLLEDQKLPCLPGLDGNASYMPPSLLLGCPVQECQDKAATANPINYVSASDPPFLIMQGMLDCLVPWRQSQMLYDALKQKGIDATLVLLPTAQHADSQFQQPKYQQMVDDFLDRTLRGPKRRRATVR